LFLDSLRLNGRSAVLAKLHDYRNRLIASPGFQRFASHHWPFRLIARRRAVALFDLCAGFVYSQVLFACVQLDLFQRLSGGARSVPDLLSDPDMASDLDAEALQRLLRAAVALGLLEERAHKQFALGAQGAAVLANPGISAMVRHHTYLYQDLIQPVAMLQRQHAPTHMQRFWRYALDNAADAELTAAGGQSSQDNEYRLYSELMASSQHMIAEQVLAAFDFSAYASALDIGGGVGEFLDHLSRCQPQLQLGLMDLPPVIEQARARQSGAEHQRRRFYPGSFLEVEIPGGYDLITLVRVLHDHDDEVVRCLLSRCAQAMSAGGRLLIAEPLAKTTGAEAMGDAYFGMYLFAMGQGRPRSFKEYQGFLQQAGFRRVRHIKTSIPMLCSLIVASVDKNV